MVWRNVDEQANARREGRREVDLIGRTLDHMRASVRRRRQFEDGQADVSAECDVAPGILQNMGDERSRRRFAVGAGDGDERRLGRSDAAFAREKLDVAHDRDASRVSEPDRPMRRRVRQRHPRRQHVEPETAPIRPSEIDEGDARGGRPVARFRAIVPGRDRRAAFDQRAQGGKSRAAKAEYGDVLSAQSFDRRHHHLSFSDARPIIASTKAMIQKRMTICASDHPRCSK